jgi:hypothetical protein
LPLKPQRRSSALCPCVGPVTSQGEIHMMRRTPRLGASRDR